MRNGIGKTPPLFVSQLVHVIMRNALDGVTDALVVRAAELFFRTQRATMHDGSLIAADEETIGGINTSPVTPLVSMLGIPAEAEIDIINDDNAGKPEGINLMIGRRPYFAFGNSTGDRQMLEYTKAGAGVRLAMLALHDDAAREYAYGPAQSLPDTKVGRFPPELYNEATKDGWIVVSMKNDWKRVFAFE